jgi:hypothetical protein
MVEPWIVVPVVAGSSPVIHPVKDKSLRLYLRLLFYIYGIKIITFPSSNQVSYLNA